MAGCARSDVMCLSGVIWCRPLPLAGEAAHHDLPLHCEEEEDTEVDHQHRPEDWDVKEPEEGHGQGNRCCHHHPVPAPGEGTTQVKQGQWRLPRHSSGALSLLQ